MRPILGVRLYAEGAGHGLITIPAGGSRKPGGPETVRAKEHLLHMRGSAVFRAAVRRVEQAVTALLKEFGFTVDDVTRVIAHQANARILEQLRRRLGLSQEAVYSVIERYGNTSSASLPIALDDAVRSQRLAAGDLVLLGAFGGGLPWATGLVGGYPLAARKEVMFSMETTLKFLVKYLKWASKASAVKCLGENHVESLDDTMVHHVQQSPSCSSSATSDRPADP